MNTVFIVSRQLSSIAFNASSVQSRIRVQFLKHSVYRVESVVHIVNGVRSVLAGLQSTAFMVCLLLFSVGSVQSSIQLSVGSVYSVQCL